MPTSIENFNALIIAEEWATAGKGVALATVIETWGSAPQPSGSHLVIDADGNFHGFVSGGCVEADIVVEARAVIASGQPKLLVFSVADETARCMGLSCGGRIQIYVERITAC